MNEDHSNSTEYRGRQYIFAEMFTCYIHSMLTVIDTPQSDDYHGEDFWW